jgi:PEP-CTERM motif-containing protein
MKKLATIICLSAMAVGAYAQGYISGNTAATGALVSTNGSSIGLTTGLTSTGGGLYEFGVFTGSATLSAGQIDPLNGGLWTFTGVYGTNDNLAAQKGGLNAPSQPANGWATGVSNAFFVAVWSANLGTSWSQIANAVSNNFASSPLGWYGLSGIGYGVAGSPPPGVAMPLFGASIPTATPINSPITLFPTIVVPEPTTFALLGLGAAGLLIFRRRKN